jgi:hypothetical protein
MVRSLKDFRKGMFTRGVSAFREFGLLAGVIYLVGQALSRTSRHLSLFYYDFMVQPVATAPLLPKSLAKAVELRELNEGDSEMALVVVRPEILKSRFKQKAVCLGAFQKEKFIGYIWFCFGGYEEDEVRCRFIPIPETESVVDFDIYLFPDYRFGLGFAGIWDGANAFLRSRGIRFSFSRLTRFNVASKRAHVRLGSKRIASALFFTAWRVQLMVATLFPYLHISVRESRRPRLKLRPDVLDNGLSTSARSATSLSE